MLLCSIKSPTNLQVHFHLFLPHGPPSQIKPMSFGSNPSSYHNSTVDRLSYYKDWSLSVLYRFGYHLSRSKGDEYFDITFVDPFL